MKPIICIWTQTSDLLSVWRWSASMACFPQPTAMPIKLQSFLECNIWDSFVNFDIKIYYCEFHTYSIFNIFWCIWINQDITKIITVNIHMWHLSIYPPGPCPSFPTVTCPHWAVVITIEEWLTMELMGISFISISSTTFSTTDPNFLSSSFSFLNTVLTRLLLDDLLCLYDDLYYVVVHWPNNCILISSKGISPVSICKAGSYSLSNSFSKLV